MHHSIPTRQDNNVVEHYAISKDEFQVCNFFLDVNKSVAILQKPLWGLLMKRF